MLTSAETQQRMAKLYDRDFAKWATASESSAIEPSSEWLIDVPLHPPNENLALSNPKSVADWIADWRAGEPRATDAVRWETRRWANAGTQTVPVRLRFAEPGQVARFAGRASHWATASSRARELLADLPSNEAVTTAIRKTLAAVATLTADDYNRLRSVLAWLLANPSSGLFVRQLPIRGIDTKWIERHSKIVNSLFTAATGIVGLGLATKPAQLRIRFLDPELAPGGIRDLTAPIEDIAQLKLGVTRVLIVENLECLLSLPDYPCTIAIHGKGYSVPLLAEIPWLKNTDIAYWGDLDTDGFNILAMVRAVLPQTRSVLMDAATVKEFRDLGVSDPNPRRAFSGPLTDSELAAIVALAADGDLRIEQERIPWQVAITVLADQG